MQRPEGLLRLIEAGLSVIGSPTVQVETFAGRLCILLIAR